MSNLAKSTSPSLLDTLSTAVEGSNGGDGDDGGYDDDARNKMNELIQNKIGYFVKQHLPISPSVAAAAIVSPL